MSEGIQLPALPQPDRVQRGFRPDADFSLFTADQMREYARLAVLEERARCARIADAEIGQCGYVPPEDGQAALYHDSACREIAAAIRQEKARTEPG